MVVNKRGANFLVVLIPSQLQVRRESTSQPLKKIQHLDLEKPNRLLAKILSSNGIDYLDLLPIFQTETQQSGTALYFDRDGHWNADGHRVAATHITQLLNETISRQQGVETQFR